MNENKLVDASFQLALLVVEYCKQLMSSQREYVLSKQLLKSGTSIGANIREAQYANSRADFIAKMHIALKECNETDYWLNLLRCSGYISNQYDELISRNIEIRKMLIATIKTAKEKH